VLFLRIYASALKRFLGCVVNAFPARAASQDRRGVETLQGSSRLVISEKFREHGVIRFYLAFLLLLFLLLLFLVVVVVVVVVIFVFHHHYIFVFIMVLATVFFFLIIVIDVLLLARCTTTRSCKLAFAFAG
jgi:hypothetical protein